MIDVTRDRDGSADSFRDDLRHLKSSLPPRLTNGDDIPRLHSMRGFHALAIEAHVPASDGLIRHRPGLEDAHAPQPHIQSSRCHAKALYLSQGTRVAAADVIGGWKLRTSLQSPAATT